MNIVARLLASIAAVPNVIPKVDDGEAAKMSAKLEPDGLKQEAKDLDVLLSPVTPEVNLPQSTRRISKLSLSGSGVQVGLGSFDENFEAAQSADWNMCICAITRRAFWKSRKTGNVTWSAPSGLDLKSETAPPRLLDSLYISKNTKSRNSHIQSLHCTPLDVQNPENFFAMIRVGADINKHVGQKSQRRFICFSSNLDRIMWSQSRSAYFQGKIKGFILTSDMLEVINGASASTAFQDNPMKTNQKECAVCIKATHRDLNLEFDTTELATAWSDALRYVLSMNESQFDEDERVSSTSSMNHDLSTIAESDGTESVSSFSDTSSSSLSFRASAQNKRTASSPSLNSETPKRNLRKGFSMKSMGSFMKMKSGVPSDRKIGNSGNRSSKKITETVKGIFKNRNSSNSMRGNRSFSGTNSNLSTVDISSVEDTSITHDTNTETSALVERNEKNITEIKRLKKDLQSHKQKLDIANSCIENLTKSLDAIMRSQFSGDVQKDLPNVPDSLEKRFSTDEWSSNIEKFVKKIANNNHLSRSISNRSILLSGKDKDALENIRKMLVGHLKSSREYTDAMPDMDPADSGDLHFVDIEAEITDDNADNDIDIKSAIGETPSMPRTKSRRARKESVKYEFNSDNMASNENESKRRRAVSTLLSSAMTDELSSAHPDQR